MIKSITTDFDGLPKPLKKDIEELTEMLDNDLYGNPRKYVDLFESQKNALEFLIDWQEGNAPLNRDVISALHDSILVATDTFDGPIHSDNLEGTRLVRAIERVEHWINTIETSNSCS